MEVLLEIGVFSHFPTMFLFQNRKSGMSQGPDNFHQHLALLPLLCKYFSKYDTKQSYTKWIVDVTANSGQFSCGRTFIVEQIETYV